MKLIYFEYPTEVTLSLILNQLFEISDVCFEKDTVVVGAGSAVTKGMNDGEQFVQSRYRQFDE
jgi:hypothetical protein